MKKLVSLFFCFLFMNSVSALELQGGVKYTVDSAREYIQQGQQNNIEIPNHYKLDLSIVEKSVYSYNSSGETIGITVQYINEPKMGYIYSKEARLIFVDKYDLPVNVYPHRGYRYKPDGTLDLTTLSVSKNEHFRFSPEGNLIAHSINGTTYDKNGNIIGYFD